MADSKKTHKVLYLAVDVEKKGASLDNPVIQLGVAYGPNINNIKTASFCFDYKDKPFEKRCYNEFWTKHLDVLKRIEQNAKPPREEWARFAKWLTALEDQAKSIEIISDNPGYDVEAIDYHLYEELGKSPMRYDSQGQYRSISDPSEQIEGLPSIYRTQIKAKTKSMSNHSHWAEDDAFAILVQYFLVHDTIQIMRKAEEDISELLKI